MGKNMGRISLVSGFYSIFKQLLTLGNENESRAFYWLIGVMRKRCDESGNERMSVHLWVPIASFTATKFHSQESITHTSRKGSQSGESKCQKAKPSKTPKLLLNSSVGVIRRTSCWDHTTKMTAQPISSVLQEVTKQLNRAWLILAVENAHNKKDEL